MAKSVPVHCPTCRREHSFTPPTFPCACGAPLTLPVQADASPELLAHRTWRDAWVAVRCPSCDRQDQWPRPEFGCSCGTVVRLPVRSPGPATAPAPGDDGSDGSDGDGAGDDGAGAGAAAGAGAGTGAGEQHAAAQRPAFRPEPIRTADDALAAAERYLTWLGCTGVTRPGDPEAAGADLRAGALVARVDPSTVPTSLRAVECLWLHAMVDSASGVFFSLAGYAHEARSRADDLRLPLFVMDLTGTPQPLNGPADELVERGPA
ncbi:hypothetical protein V7793_28695 [Streptomyces sp. KLMMK]|uniref:hypothetical protein n=1 Tax=Streptomyces sp. KLMMK TaxID=3109353 RepID=UPI00300AA1F3